jgi:putative PIN family toxin of toxin-antitoxin system
MRIVVDTNVFVSAALKDKSIPSIALHLAAQRDVLLKSAATEAQLFDVIMRPCLLPLIAPATSDWFRLLMAKAELITITENVAACRDSTDDKFLELAVSGRADLILTGDADLLVLDPFRGISIVSPATFTQQPSRQN